jgi:hypothetical protein
VRAFAFVFSTAVLTVGSLFPFEPGRHIQLPAQPADDLTRPIAISDSPSPAYVVALGAMLASGTPGGVTFDGGCPDHSEPVIRPHGTTLREVLDSITEEDASYAWNMKQGVVNLVPSGGAPAFLKMNLDTYDSGDLANASEAVVFLASSPEVTRDAAKLGLQKNPSGSPLGSASLEPRPPQKPLSIRLQNVTLLGVLNAIARANKHGVWTYYEKKCGSVHQFDLTFTE